MNCYGFFIVLKQLKREYSFCLLYTSDAADEL